jgi:hypothetical protein
MEHSNRPFTVKTHRTNMINSAIHSHNAGSRDKTAGAMVASVYSIMIYQFPLKNGPVLPYPPINVQTLQNLLDRPEMLLTLLLLYV